MSLDFIQNIKLFPKMETTLMTLDRHEDNRGEFMQIWQESLHNINIRQINVSVSNKGVLRGLHFQKFWRQQKLLTVLKGSIIDIVLDIRPNSESFGKFNFIHLDKGDQLLVPDAVAHGFLALQNETIVMYQTNRTRFESEEVSIRAVDAKIEHAYDQNTNLGIFLLEQMTDHSIVELKVSEKDINAKDFNNFEYGTFLGANNG